MVREIKGKSLSKKLQGVGKNPFFIPILFLLFLVLTVPVVTLVAQKTTDFEQKAASSEIVETINTVRRQSSETAMTTTTNNSGSSQSNSASSSNSLDVSFPVLLIVAISGVTLISIAVLGFAFFRKRSSLSS